MYQVNFKDKERKKYQALLQKHLSKNLRDISKGIQLQIELNELISLSEKYCITKKQKQHFSTDNKWSNLPIKPQTLRAARSVIKQSQKDQSLVSQIQKKRKLFQMDWINQYGNFTSRMSQDEQDKLVGMCTGGYMFFNADQNRKIELYKNFYTILSTIHPNGNKDNIMPILSEKIKTEFMKNHKLTIEEAVKIPLKPFKQLQFMSRVKPIYHPLTSPRKSRPRMARNAPKTAFQPVQKSLNESVNINDLMTIYEDQKEKKQDEETNIKIKKVHKMVKSSDQKLTRIYSSKRTVHWAFNMSNLNKLKENKKAIEKYIEDQQVK